MLPITITWEANYTIIGNQFATIKKHNNVYVSPNAYY
jgi:hypothetical protein